MRAALLCLALCVGVAHGLSLWPWPVSVSNGSALAGFNANVMFTSTCEDSSILDEAFRRVFYQIFWNGNGTSAPWAGISTVKVCVQSSNTTLQFGIDESYDLSVSTSAVTITAPTVYGAMWALQTLTQITQYNDTNNFYYVAGLPIAISDEPRYSWRGMLVDTARHYYPSSFLYHILDTMSYSKFNVMHWHITDAQSFPFVSVSYPLLSKAGAYYPTAIYTPTTISSIVKYGAMLGIRVVVEFDGPGHAAGWARPGGYPEIGTVCPYYEANINNIPLNPASNMTLPILSGVYHDASSLFFDEWYHLGGDEVVDECWAQDPQVVKWCEEHDINDTIGVYQYFIDQMKMIAESVQRKTLFWEDPFDAGLTIPPQNTIIEVWRDKNTLKDVVEAGFDALLAAGNYLDQQLPNDTATWYEWQDTWINFYMNDPTFGLHLTEEQEARVLGGEACMWSEQVMVTNFDSRVWPRASAVAERLWSPQSVNDPNEAANRINDHSCLMQRRGVMCGPLQPSFCLLPGQASFQTDEIVY